jgi:phage terminase small subunit
MRRNITPKQERFLSVYLDTGNASEAYRQAYNCQRMKDTTIVVKASELLKNGNVAVRLQQLQNDLKKISDIKKESILEELACIAFSDIRDYVIFNGSRIRFKSFEELTDQQAKAIESIKKGRNGIELKLHGKSWSIERICRMLGFDSPEDINLSLERMPDPVLDEIINRLMKKEAKR